MPNVMISDLPLAVLPLDGPTSFFEVQTVENGVDVSRKVAADNIVVSAGLPAATALGQTLFASTLPDTYSASSAVRFGTQARADATGEIIVDVGETTLNELLLRGNTTTGLFFFAITGQGQPFNTGFQIQQLGANTNIIASDNESPPAGPTTLTISVGDGVSNRQTIQANGTVGSSFLQLQNPDSTASTLLRLEDDRMRVRNTTLLTELFNVFEGTSNRGISVQIGEFNGQNFGAELRLNVPNDNIFYLNQLGASGGLPVRQDTWMTFEQNGAVGSFHNNVQMTRTALATAGGYEINNTVTGAGFERALTQSDAAITATTTQLNDITDAINTSALKVAGYEVFNTTTGAPVWATGNADGSVWNDATGATANTPV